MYTRTIIDDNIYHDIREMVEADKNKYDPLFLISNLLGLAAFAALDKVYLTLNGKEETTTNILLANIGKSGAGKTNSNNFILNHLKNIEQQNFAYNEKIKLFGKACKDVSGDFRNNILIGGGGDEVDEKTEFVDQYYKNHFEDDPMVSRDDLYFTIHPSELYKPQFVAQTFTEEGLRQSFKNADKKLLLNSPELELLIENLSRTSISNNPYTTLIDLVDGFRGVKMLVGGNEYQAGKVVVITNTIHSKMDKFKKEFFNQTLAYRTFFVIGDDEQTDYFQDRLGEYEDEYDQTYMKKFDGRVKKLTELLLEEFGKLEEPITIDINSKESFDQIKKDIKDLRSMYFNEEKIQYINNDIVEGISNRFEFKLMQCILILHVLNTAYDHIVKPEGSFIDKLKNIEFRDVRRGIQCFKHYVKHMFALLEPNVKTELNETQQFIVNSLNEGDQMLLDEFITKIVNTGYTNQKGVFKKVSKKTIQTFLLDDKSTPYLQVIQSKGGVKTIKRKVGV